MNDLLEAFGITKEDLQEEEKTAKDKKKQSKNNRCFFDFFHIFPKKTGERMSPVLKLK